MPARPGEMMLCADLHTERMPPPVGTRGVLGTHRRGAGGVALWG
ncbi:hypothetical protein ACFXKK_36260 [Streptomyces globisporus]